MLAGLASVFALREDCSQSLHHGIRRVGGNTVAGILGVTLIAIKDFLGLDFSVDFFGTIIAVIILSRSAMSWTCRRLSSAQPRPSLSFSTILMIPKRSATLSKGYWIPSSVLPSPLGSTTCCQTRPKHHPKTEYLQQKNAQAAIHWLLARFSYSTDLSASIMSTCFSLRCIINMTTLENNNESNPAYR